MWLMILKKYWLEIAIFLSACILILYINHLHSEISSLEKDNTVLQSKLSESNAYINTQNALILANEADYNASISKLPTVLHKIDTEYVTKTVEIEKWRDNNASQNDCNASMQYLNSYRFTF
jgi:GTPase involved in cell partitioning and DNA repair